MARKTVSPVAEKDDGKPDDSVGTTVGETNVDATVDAAPLDAPDSAAEPTEAETASLLAFADWANGEEVDDLEPFVAMGLIDPKHSLTDAGKALLDDQKIGWRQMYFIRIGIPVVTTSGVKIMDGSSLMIVNGGYDEAAGSKFWLCFAGEQLPILTVYQNSLHQFWDASYPLNQKMAANYVKAAE